MITVSIALYRSGFANISNGFSLNMAQLDEANGDDVAQYILPEGFEIGQTVMGETAIYDTKSVHWDVSTDNGRPVLVSDRGMIALRKAS